MRAAFSLAASCYIVAALVFPGFWLLGDAHLALAAWWPAYLAAELVLVVMVLLVVYGFLVIPAGCFIALPHRTNLVAGCLAFAIAALTAMAYIAYTRRTV